MVNKLEKELYIKKLKLLGKTCLDLGKYGLIVFKTIEINKAMGMSYIVIDVDMIESIEFSNIIGVNDIKGILYQEGWFFYKVE